MREKEFNDLLERISNLKQNEKITLNLDDDVATQTTEQLEIFFVVMSNANQNSFLWVTQDEVTPTEMKLYDLAVFVNNIEFIKISSEKEGSSLKEFLGTKIQDYSPLLPAISEGAFQVVHLILDEKLIKNDAESASALLFAVGRMPFCVDLNNTLLGSKILKEKISKMIIDTNATEVTVLDWKKDFSEMELISNYMAIVERMVDAGVGLNASNLELGFTPLMFAVAKCNLPLVRFLLDNGADINYINTNAATNADFPNVFSLVDDQYVYEDLNLKAEMTALLNAERLIRSLGIDPLEVKKKAIGLFETLYSTIPDNEKYEALKQTLFLSFPPPLFTPELCSALEIRLMPTLERAASLSMGLPTIKEITSSEGEIFPTVLWTIIYQYIGKDVSGYLEVQNNNRAAEIQAQSTVENQISSLSPSITESIKPNRG